MARLPRVCLPSIPQHIIQRGNNRQVCFVSEEDFSAYAYWLYQYAKKFEVSIHAWVFMTNHVHLLVTPTTKNGVSNLMQMLGRHYVRYFNYTYKRTGTLWEGRFKSCLVEAESYFLTCQRYIELNPIRAGMVESPSDYHWSSYQANGLGREIALWTPHQIYIDLGHSTKSRLDAYRALFQSHVNVRDIALIRNATNKGLAVGNDHFKSEIERLSGRRVVALKRGPKPKEKEFLL
ncbi:MAG: transposase [Gammaproteobacteria bacterium]|nr:transposase [Gammaproteobacteria bacterium]